MNTQTVVLAGGSAELVASINSCIRNIAGCGVGHHPTIAQARESLPSQENPGLLLVYLKERSDLPAALELITLAQSRSPAIPLVVIAESEGDIDRGELLNAGAADCLLRPLNLSRLAFLIDFLTLRARSMGSIANVDVAEWETVPPPARSQVPVPKRHVSASPVPAPVSEIPVPANMVFVSERSKSLLKTVRRLAHVDSNVLLTGETGTGKTCLARLMHDLSPRSKSPFVVVNCGAIPESLLESELFGHGQGAFTGADRNYRGKFAQAENGTLFLDEIDSLPLSSQSSLLRVVEDRAFEAVGSGKSQQVASRLIFATNRNLADEVKAGRFRLDLYYRLNVVSLGVPPLRERSGAVPSLAKKFLQDLRDRGMTSVEYFTEECLSAMAAYHWPGNVRELKNVVERIAVLAEKPGIDVEDLPEEITRGQLVVTSSGTPDLAQMFPAAEYSLSFARHAAERETIVTTLKRCQDNRTKAAEVLGISRAAFYKKLNRLGIA